MCTYGLERPEFGQPDSSNDLRRLIAALLLPGQFCHGEPCDDCIENSLNQADALIDSLKLTVTAGVIVGCAHG